MLRPICAAIACATLFALPGCGGSDSDKSSASKPDAQQVAAQDAEAKSNARNLVSQLEACFAGSGSYADCGLQEDGTVGGEDTGFGEQAAAGDLTTEVQDQTYTVTAKSKSGTEFSVVKAEGGAMERHCTPEGEGGCAADGTW
jgi:type IV pilus assembly protein PilA